MIAAQWATLSRLLSCIVTEGLVHAIFIPADFDFIVDIDDTSSLPFRSPSFVPQSVGVAVILDYTDAKSSNRLLRDVRSEDILLVVPLVGVPIPTATESRITDSPEELEVFRIGLLDPLDMFPISFSVSPYREESTPVCRFPLARVSRLKEALGCN